MIPPQTRFRLARIPLSQIVVTEHQARYVDRVLHYVLLLQQPDHRDSDAGFVQVKPLPGAQDWRGRPLYTLLDGHHRYCASIIVGRATLLAVIHYAPGDAGYDEALIADARVSEPIPAPS